MILKTKLFGHVYAFRDVKDVLARANEYKSGDELAGVAAESAEERVAAKVVLSELTLHDLRENPSVGYDEDEVTRIIQDDVNEKIYGEIRNWTVSDLREYLLSEQADARAIARISRGLTSEMIAACAKLMGNLDLIYAAQKIRVTARCNTTIGLPGTLSCRLQPNHTTDDPDGVLASLAEGLSFGAGDAVLGLNPVDDSVESVTRILRRFADMKEKWAIPTQTCVLAHVTTQMDAIRAGAPADLIFQSRRARSPCTRARQQGRTSCTLRPVRARSCRARRTSAQTRSRWRRAATALRGIFRRFLSIRSSASSARSTSMTPSRSSARGWRITSWASCTACPWAATRATPTT